MTIRVAVWGTGNVGRAAIRMINGHPELELTAVIVSDPAKVGRDAGELAGLGRSIDVAASADSAEVLGHVEAVAYCASADFRPDAALDDIVTALRAGASVVTPGIYPLYDPPSAPAAVRDPIEAACRQGGTAFFANGIDPGWGNDVLPLLLTGFCSEITEVRAQEIFDYSSYQAEAAVRELVGFGMPMDYDPPMVMQTVPTSVWGGQLRLLARALDIVLDEIVEHVERLPLETNVTTDLGDFAAGTQGALRFEVRGMMHGRAVLVVEHVTRIHPDCAPEWPQPPDGAAGAHRVIIEGRPRIVVTIEAEDEGGNRAAGGNATAAARLVGSIPWLCAAAPGLYDALQVPLLYGRGRVKA
ncbi:MAG: NAD(P)H-dependent amine dehydrogenase family protein [Acidimicrobiales bacterium]